MISNEAREAAARLGGYAFPPVPGYDDEVDRLAQAFQAAIDAQRERDAKIADAVVQIEEDSAYLRTAKATALQIAAAIRSAKP